MLLGRQATTKQRLINLHFDRYNDEAIVGTRMNCRSIQAKEPTNTSVPTGEKLVVSIGNRLIGLVVKAFASRAADLAFDSRLRGFFSGMSHTSDLKIGTPVATLLGVWRYKVSTGTGWSGVSIL